MWGEQLQSRGLLVSMCLRHKVMERSERAGMAGMAGREAEWQPTVSACRRRRVLARRATGHGPPYSRGHTKV